MPTRARRQLTPSHVTLRARGECLLPGNAYVHNASLEDALSPAIRISSGWPMLNLAVPRLNNLFIAGENASSCARDSAASCWWVLCGDGEYKPAQTT